MSESEQNFVWRANEIVRNKTNELRASDALDFIINDLIPIYSAGQSYNGVNLTESRLRWNDRNPSGEVEMALVVVLFADIAARLEDREMFNSVLNLRDVSEKLGETRVEGLEDTWDAHNDPDWSW